MSITMKQLQKDMREATKLLIAANSSIDSPPKAIDRVRGWRDDIYRIARRLLWG